MRHKTPHFPPSGISYLRMNFAQMCLWVGPELRATSSMASIEIKTWSVSHSLYCLMCLWNTFHQKNVRCFTDSLYWAPPNPESCIIWGSLGDNSAFPRSSDKGRVWWCSGTNSPRGVAQGSWAPPQAGELYFKGPTSSELRTSQFSSDPLICVVRGWDDIPEMLI